MFEKTKDSYTNKKKKWRWALKINLSNAVLTINLFHPVRACVGGGKRWGKDKEGSQNRQEKNAVLKIE